MSESGIEKPPENGGDYQWAEWHLDQAVRRLGTALINDDLQSDHPEAMRDVLVAVRNSFSKWKRESRDR